MHARGQAAKTKLAESLVAEQEQRQIQKQALVATKSELANADIELKHEQGKRAELEEELRSLSQQLEERRQEVDSLRYQAVTQAQESPGDSFCVWCCREHS